MEGKDAKNELFERMNPSRALALMALPTVASQMILLVYNPADTWFIGRTNDPYMVGASSLALTIYLAATALANVFGTGVGLGSLLNVLLDPLFMFVLLPKGQEVLGAGIAWGVYRKVRKTR